ncbi:MAG: flagellar FlbD family protein [bacterium]
MIIVRRLNDKEFVINAGLIKYVESTPDTVITLLNNEKIMVKESVQEVCEKVIEYYKKLRC